MIVVAQVEKRLRELPDRPGIYIFRDADRKPLYIGKAKSLRKRGASYLRPPEERRIGRMLAEARELDFVVSGSEAEALDLENSWIKSKRPRYNIRLRDDKTYPYLKLTAEPYPQLAFTRRIRDDGADYFGPYLPAGLARKAIKLVQQLFQIRVCRIPIDGKLPRPCLYHDMHRCLGPCVEGLTDPETYGQAVAEARLFLSGRHDQLVRQLKRRMLDSSEALEFEDAARLRDMLREIEEISVRRNVSSVRGEDVDIYGVQVAGHQAALTILVMRGGRVLDRRELFWEGEDEIEAGSLLSEVLPQIYQATPFIPKEVHLPAPIDEDDGVVAWLQEKKGEKVYVRYPSRGPKADRVALAMRNAELAFKRRFRTEHRGTAAVRSLARHLQLAEPPQRIEGFDISHFQGAETVASMVVWEAGRMRKGEYRSFNIRDLDKPDDFASMRQAVERRYRRRLDEVGAMPDLVLIDGGRGQLNAALEALALLGVEETPIVALAKRDEELYVPALPQPLRLAKEDYGLQLLQEIRDESHRFAVARHRRRRKAKTLTSRIDRLPGIGPKRRKRLLSHFASFAGVQRATEEELIDILGRRLGVSVFAQLHPPEGAEEGSATEDPEAAKS